MECQECNWTQFFTKDDNGEKYLICERCGTRVKEKKNKIKYDIIEEVE